MEPSVLKYAILRLVEEHEASNAGTFLDDKIIAASLGVGLDVVQRQLLILENRGLVQLAKAMGPSYGALLTPDGMEALEAVDQQQPEPARRAIGF
jgi:DNA-binding GntR family transcriptional regulator